MGSHDQAAHNEMDQNVWMQLSLHTNKKEKKTITNDMDKI